MEKEMKKEDLIENQNFVNRYRAIFKSADWKVGTKKDPKKELGFLKFSILVPRADETTYIVDIDELVFDKENMPKKKIEPFTPIIVEYEHNR